MIISTICHNGKEDGSSVLVCSNDEGRMLLTAMQEYCDNHKRKKKTKNLLKYMENNLQCF